MNGPGDPNQGNYPPQGGYPPQSQPGYLPQGQPGYPPQQGQPGQGGYPPQQPYQQGYPAQKSNTALLVTLIVLVVAAIAGGAILYFTGAFGGGGGSKASTNVSVAQAPSTSTPAPVPVTVTPPPAATPGPGGAMSPAQVEAGLQLGVAQFQSRLPLRNGPATITSVSSSGTTLTMVMEISQALQPAEWSQFQGEFQRSLCSGPFANAIRAGASAEVIVSDTTGQSETYNISSC